MNKIPTLLAASLVALAAWAQPSARVNDTKPSGNSPIRLAASKMAHNAKKTNLLIPDWKRNAAKPAKVRKAAGDGPLIMEQPEGTLFSNLYAEGQGYYPYWDFAVEADVDAALGNYVLCDNGDIYIRNAICTMPSGAWIKGTKAADGTINVELPQKYYSQPVLDDNGEETEETEYFYAWRMIKEEVDVDGQEGLTMTPDETSQTIKYVLRNDSLIRVDTAKVYMAVGDETGTWTGFGDHINQMSPETMTIATPPADAAVTKYLMTYSADDVTADSRCVDVAIKGDDIYIGSFTDDVDNAWIKGRLEGGKAIFTDRAYIGINHNDSCHAYFSPAGYVQQDGDYGIVDSIYIEKDLVFDCNTESNTMKAEGTFLVNNGKKFIYPAAHYNAPSLRLFKPVAAAPADPEIVDFQDYDSGYGYGNVAFTLSSTSADGGDLDPAKLYYNIYFDNDLFTFRKSEYTKLPEDEITDMPYGYSDKWDIFSYGNKRSMYFYKSDYTSFGVQALYKDGDTVYRSNIVRYGELDGISATEAANAKSMEYTDLCGREVKSPSTGIYIMTTKFADGTKKSVKVIR